MCHTGFPLVRRKNAETGTSPDFGCPASRDGFRALPNLTIVCRISISAVRPSIAGSWHSHIESHRSRRASPSWNKKTPKPGFPPDFGYPAVRDENSVNAELHPRVPDFDFCRASPDHREQAQPAGGPGGDRTHDLCVANAALSQLSYKPIQKDPAGLPFCHFPCAYCITFLCRLQVFFCNFRCSCP